MFKCLYIQARSIGIIKPSLKLKLYAFMKYKQQMFKQVYLYVCLRQAQANLTYERKTYKRKYKVLLSEYAMHLYGLQAYQSVCDRGKTLKLMQA